MSNEECVQDSETDDGHVRRQRDIAAQHLNLFKYVNKNTSLFSLIHTTMAELGNCTPPPTQYAARWYRVSGTNMIALWVLAHDDRIFIGSCDAREWYSMLIRRPETVPYQLTSYNEQVSKSWATSNLRCPANIMARVRKYSGAVIPDINVWVASNGVVSTCDGVRVIFDDCTDDYTMSRVARTPHRFEKSILSKVGTYWRNLYDVKHPCEHLDPACGIPKGALCYFDARDLMQPGHVHPMTRVWYLKDSAALDANPDRRTTVKDVTKWTPVLVRTLYLHGQMFMLSRCTNVLQLPGLDMHVCYDGEIEHVHVPNGTVLSVTKHAAPVAHIALTNACLKVTDMDKMQLLRDMRKAECSPFCNIGFEGELDATSAFSLPVVLDAVASAREFPQVMMLVGRLKRSDEQDLPKQNFLCQMHTFPQKSPLTVCVDVLVWGGGQRLRDLPNYIRRNWKFLCGAIVVHRATTHCSGSLRVLATHNKVQISVCLALPQLPLPLYRPSALRPRGKCKRTRAKAWTHAKVLKLMQLRDKKHFSWKTIAQKLKSTPDACRKSYVRVQRRPKRRRLTLTPVT